MCETSATPLHSDGLLGDAINFLLTGSYEATTSHDREYSEAQAQGQVSSGDVNKILSISISIYLLQLSGDCSPYHNICPVSLFKYS